MSGGRAGARIAEARDALRQMGLPKAQQNDRSALALLALLGLGPGTPWKSASAPMLGITAMMGVFRRRYGRRYAPNTRETVRRHSIHQFLRASLVAANPDMPDRPTNSGRTVYQMRPDALALLRAFGTPAWGPRLERYLKSRGARGGARNGANRIPVRLPGGGELRLSPGSHSALVERICSDFAARFVPGGALMLAGDTARASGYHDRGGLRRLGVTIRPRGKVPDVIIHDRRRGRLVAVEAVSTHGPIDPKRRDELRELFSGARTRVVYVTAFASRRSMTRHLGRISWGTDVWLADEPGHLIHFDGARFMGRYA